MLVSPSTQEPLHKVSTKDLICQSYQPLAIKTTWEFLLELFQGSPLHFKCIRIEQWLYVFQVTLIQSLCQGLSLFQVDFSPATGVLIGFCFGFVCFMIGSHYVALAESNYKVQSSSLCRPGWPELRDQSVSVSGVLG